MIAFSPLISFVGMGGDIFSEREDDALVCLSFPCFSSLEKSIIQGSSFVHTLS